MRCEKALPFQDALEAEGEGRFSSEPAKVQEENRTSQEFVGLIQGHGIQVSMDGKGRWVDNVFVERLWKSVKYEEVYRHAYDTVSQAQQGLESYFTFYNERRPHSSLDGKTPDTVYFNSLPIKQAA